MKEHHIDSVCYYLPLSTERFSGYYQVGKKIKITAMWFFLDCVAYIYSAAQVHLGVNTSVLLV